MKTIRNCFQIGLLIALTLALNPIAQAASEMAHAAGVPARQVGQTNASSPWDQIGTKASADYNGDGLAVTPTQSGARLHCVFQRLDGEATRGGLWLVSTTTNMVADRFQVKAAAIGRTENKIVGDLRIAGEVAVDGKNVRFVRSGLTEEYSVSMDGVRQDFVVTQKPAGAGELLVRLDVSGAQVKPATGGAQLVLVKSGRKIAYNRLRVTDTTGKELSARMEAGTELAVVVNDAGAVYPVRIDPTFSDANWSPLGSGMNGDVRALAVSGGTLYAGGYFTTAGDGSTNLNYIAQWNGSSWSPLGSGMNNRVLALAVSGTNLYAVGWFTTAGGTNANYIAQWNGSSWSPLGSGMNDWADALAVSGGTLYAGGGFTTAGGTNANYIAQWNGSSWAPLGSGMGGPNPYVHALAMSGGTLYAGGWFTTAGGTNANYIAQWNGSSWTPLGPGMGGGNSPGPSVLALAVSGTNLYAGGQFTTAGSNAASNTAQWNGSSWSPLGSGMSGVSNPYVFTLAVSGGTLYAGGWFTTAGGTNANYIAQWNGSSWSPLGSGMNSEVDALAVSGSTLYVGGSFTMAGGKEADCVAEAVFSPSPAFVIVTTNGNFGFAKKQFNFTLTGPAGSNAVISASTNMHNWLPLATNPLVGGSLIFTDALATNFPSRFYRATLQP